MDPLELKNKLTGGLFSFPVTDFDESGNLHLSQYRERLEWATEFDIAAVCPAGGAGEFFSLTFSEYRQVTAAAVEICGGTHPVIAAAGQGTYQAIEFAAEAERLGVDGILIFPPYMVEGSQAGLRAHIKAICQSTQLGVIVYNRGQCRLQYSTMVALAGDCPNLIGIKDGIGDIEGLAKLQSACGDRLMIINGMPTAEVYAQPYSGLGCLTYSSALLNFLPRLAVDFHGAIRERDLDYVHQVTSEFLIPYIAIRNRERGYAVSIVKAGAAIVGRSAGTVRPPLSPLTVAEMDSLEGLITVAKSIRPRHRISDAMVETR